jgi:tight adherence protein B
MRRLAQIATVLAAWAAFTSSAEAGTRISGIDPTGLPRISVSVVTSTPVTAAPRLTENGAAVAGLSATNLGRAKSVVLAIDRSQSMAGTSIRDATAAAEEFVGLKLPSDRVSVIAFGHSPETLAALSTASGDADAALSGLSVDSVAGTALYDAIVASANSLRGAPGGHVVIVLTDGRDVSSSATLADAVAAARRAHASVYTIGIASHQFDPAALQALAVGTNGSYHRASTTAALGGVYSAIAAELSRTWRLAYYTAARPGDRVTVQVDAPGSGSAAASFAAPRTTDAVVADGSSGLFPSVAYSFVGTFMVALVVGAFVLAAALMLGRRRNTNWVRGRIAPHIGERPMRSVRRRERLAFLATLFQFTEAAFGQRRQWRWIQRLLIRGDVPLRPAEFIWASVGCGSLLGVLLAVVGAPTVVIVGGLALGGAGPCLFVSFRVRKRTRAFEDQLPDLLTTIAASLKAGHSFRQGLQAVVEEAQEPAGRELKRVLTEAGLGRPIDDALGDMADRLGSENFEFAITAVAVQRQVGGSLASLFDMVSETVRQRQQFARKIRSLTAMGRMSSYTLIGIPFFIAGAIMVLNPTYLQPLFHTGVGRMLLFGGLAMMVVGSLMLKKIVSFRG